MYVLAVSWLLLSTSPDMTLDTNKYRERRQSQGPINPCDIDCMCEVTPVCWNQMLSCPAAFGELTVVESNYALNVGEIGTPGIEDSFIPDQGSLEGGPIEDYNFIPDLGSPENGPMEDHNFIPDLGSPEGGPMEDNNFIPDLGSPENGPMEEDNFIPDRGSPKTGPFEGDNFDPGPQGPERGTLEKDNFGLDKDSANRKRRSKARDPESHRERSETSTINRKFDTSMRRQNTSCIYPMIYREPLLAEFKDHFRHTMLRMIHTCQYEYIGSDLQSNCFDFKNTSSLENVIPVLDSATKRVFANRFCAECSGIHDYNEFITQFICNSKLFEEWEFLSMDRTHDNQMKLIKLGICIYYFKPPEQSIELIPENQCIAVTYKHCNQTENKVVRGIYLWNLCDSKDWFKDENTCSLSDDHSYQTRTSDFNSLLRRCSTRCREDLEHVMSVSFFALMSLERTPMITEDKLLSGQSRRRCQNQSGDVYDQHTVRQDITSFFEISGQVRHNHDC